MKLVVGLGNPGPRYRRTRHNLGYRVVDALAARWHIGVGGRRYDCELGSGEIAGERVVLAKPLTFMNLSGEAVGKLRRVHKLEPADIIAAYDELDLPFGRVRIRGGGGPGGHRGVVSLIEVLGKGFPRVRIGIGRPPGGSDPAAFVLEHFDPGEEAPIEAAVERAADGIETLVGQGLETAMNAFNRAEPAGPANPA
jgi:peptidyl-tRNA hydrolase, PTH1 family